MKKSIKRGHGATETRHEALADYLENIYNELNRAEYIHPDPLEFLWNYTDPADVEVVGFLASGLAFGRVAQILTSVSRALKIMGSSPGTYVIERSHREMLSDFADFRHRFVGGQEMAALLSGMGQMRRVHGSMGAFFSAAAGSHPTLQPALAALVAEIQRFAPESIGYLSADPTLGSACKRLYLFLRWMIRKDEVDPGIWDSSLASRLVVPLDTHMHRIGGILGFTTRKQADFRTALEVTEGFRTVSPTDPVKYDFALTRLGIRSEMNMDSLVDFMGNLTK